MIKIEHIGPYYPNKRVSAALAYISNDKSIDWALSDGNLRKLRIHYLNGTVKSFTYEMIEFLDDWYNY